MCSGGIICISLWRLILYALSENVDCDFFALDMRSRGEGIGVAAWALTALVRSSLSNGVIAPGLGVRSVVREFRTCRLRSLSIFIASSYTSVTCLWRAAIVLPYWLEGCGCPSLLNKVGLSLSLCAASTLTMTGRQARILA